MSVTENPKKIDAPPIVKLNKALKLVIILLENRVYVLYSWEVVSELFDMVFICIHSDFRVLTYTDECFVRFVC